MEEKLQVLEGLSMSATSVGRSLGFMMKKLKFVTTVATILSLRLHTASMRRDIWCCTVSKDGSRTKRFFKLRRESSRNSKGTKSINMPEERRSLQSSKTDYLLPDF